MQRRNPRRRWVDVALLTTMLTATATVSSSTGGAVVVSAGSAVTTAALVTIGPVRLADTREADCGCRRLGDTTISVDVAGRDDVPDDAVSAVVTLTALRTDGPGFATVFPSGTPRPDTSTLNTRADRIVANTTIVALGDDGRLAIHSSKPTQLVVDLTAVFVPTQQARAGRYVPVAGRRLVDTRTTAAPTGAIEPGGELTIPIPSGVDPDATALVVNLTSVRAPVSGFLSVRPAGAAPTGTSVLNPNGTATAVAGATVVPVSADGFTIDVVSGGHVIVDLLGWFTGPSADDSSDGLLVPIAPRRILDTRTGPDRLYRSGGLEVDSPFPDAAALVTNVTVVRPDHRGFVTAAPAGRPAPGTSTVNPGRWNHIVANLAITQVSDRGTVYRSFGGTDLIVDVTGWFTGAPVDATDPPPSNDAPRERVLLVGDSTLAALDVYTEARAALTGFDAVIDAASCRRLLRPSCRSDTTGQVPNTAVEAIGGTPGHLDIVVVKAGYNDWFSDFPAEFDAVVRAARSKGAHTVVWLTYNETVSRSTARRAYQENNADLRRLVSLPAYSDVLLADWLRYSDGRLGWFADGTHTTREGTWALADFVSRWVAAVEHRPCPRPWTFGAEAPSPCPPPELIGPVVDARSLY